MTSYKVIMVGATQVGKTATLLRFNDKEVPEKLASTVGIDFMRKSIDFDGKTVTVCSLISLQLSTYLGTNEC